VQTTGSGLPEGYEDISWSRPADYEYLGAFSGTPGSPASHEGVDYVHDNQSVSEVDILAAADGEVVYVRLGCPQSSEFSSNNSLRECGAGWGNHVVVDHGNGIYTRYAHLKPDETIVQVEDHVNQGSLLGLMENSGRSDTRHLHFELGTKVSDFDPCSPAQSFDLVYDSELLPWQ
jgi:murein DD-endopeptidase MepM/ murein hydrolase activator NlpD